MHAAACLRAAAQKWGLGSGCSMRLLPRISWLFVGGCIRACISDLIGSVGKQKCARIGDRNSELCACAVTISNGLWAIWACLIDCLTIGAATPTACNNAFVFLDFHRSPARTVLKAPISQVVKKRNPSSLFRARLDRALEASPPAQSRVIDKV
jgi:hypothetical protein